MQNALSIDVEDWFCANNLASLIPRQQWDQCESRVVGTTREVLSILQAGSTRATFFVLGWVAERFPQLVREIVAAGHELATHGYFHRLLTEMTPAEFEEDLGRSLDVLRNISSEPVIGFRAPSFTIVKSTFWALPILERAGIRYDSSVFPVGFHPDYGVADAPRSPYRISSSLWEFPLTVWRSSLGLRVPVSGGGYFRLFPYALTQYGLRRHVSAGYPIMFYLHPWELDPEQPRLPLPWSKRFRHYTNLGRTKARLQRLIQNFRFTTVREALGL